MDEFPAMKELAKKMGNEAAENIELNGISILELCNRLINSTYSVTCNLRTCRYNKDGICQNEEKLKECVYVSLRVLCLNRED